MSDPQPAPSSSGRFVVPIIVIVLGLAWLLTNMQVMPQVDWVFVLLLALAGSLLLVIRPISRVRLIAGLIMVTVALGEVLADLGFIDRAVEIPALVVLGGLYALVAQFVPERIAPEADDGSAPETPADQG